MPWHDFGSTRFVQCSKLMPWLNFGSLQLIIPIIVPNFCHGLILDYFIWYTQAILRNKMYMHRRSSRPSELLKYLALGTGILILSTITPTLPTQLLRAYIKSKRFQRSLFLRDLKRLQARECLAYYELPDGSLKIVLKSRGRQIALRYKFNELRIKIPPRWDGKWRLVMFDIPHTKKSAREALRQKLKELGFYQLQKSVFIFPYECANEIDFISEVFEIRNHILLITTNDFEGAEKLKYRFGLLKT
jgi:hypothetical protein